MTNPTPTQPTAEQIAAVKEYVDWVRAHQPGPSFNRLLWLADYCAELVEALVEAADFRANLTEILHGHNVSDDLFEEVMQIMPLWLRECGPDSPECELLAKWPGRT